MNSCFVFVLTLFSHGWFQILITVSGTKNNDKKISELKKKYFKEINWK